MFKCSLSEPQIHARINENCVIIMGFFTQNDSATNVFPLLLFPGQIQMELILENEFEGQFQSPHFRFIEKLTTTYAFLYNR